jgi:hypothetical protein
LVFINRVDDFVALLLLAAGGLLQMRRWPVVFRFELVEDCDEKSDLYYFTSSKIFSIDIMTYFSREQSISLSPQTSPQTQLLSATSPITASNNSFIIPASAIPLLHKSTHQP